MTNHLNIPPAHPDRDPLRVPKRADRAFHDPAQQALHEFSAATDGGRQRDRDWRESAYLKRRNWPEAIPWDGPKREYGPYPWKPTFTHEKLDGRDDYPHTHPDAASIGTHYMGDVCPYCGVPLSSEETVINAAGKRGRLGDVTAVADPDPAYHVNCYKQRRAEHEHTLGEFE